jgi:hypothetical protein
MDRVRSKPKFTYDDQFDVLRVFIKPVNSSYFEEISDDFYVRFSEENDDIVGIVIMDFKKKNILELRKISPIKVDFKSIKYLIQKNKY